MSTKDIYGSFYNIANGWVKHYITGAVAIGSDELVGKGKASWRNSSSNGINKVSLFHNGKSYVLDTGKGEYWQSDSYTAIASPEQTSPGKLQVRRVERKLTEEDVGKWLFLEVDAHGSVKVSLQDERK